MHAETCGDESFTIKENLMHVHANNMLCDMYSNFQHVHANKVFCDNNSYTIL